MIRKWNSGSSFEAIGGYDRALRVGQFVFISGTTGFDYASKTISSDFEDQVRQALHNVSFALRSVGSSPFEVVRLRWIITERRFFTVAGPLIREFFQEVRPPATTIVADLVDDRMLFEIDATAFVGGREISDKDLVVEP